MRFDLEGHPFTPYVRMTRRGKWVQERALLYLASQGTLKAIFREQMLANGWEPFRREPLGMEIAITMPGRLHKQDLDNQEKAIIDAAQGIVFPNDCWIDEKHSKREIGGDWLITVRVWRLK
jgi:hypothetical protein